MQDVRNHAVEVAMYLVGAGLDASPAEHRRVLHERWPRLSLDDLQRALDLVWEFRLVDETMQAS